MKINAILLTLIVLMSCDTKKDAIGPYDRIVVFSNYRLFNTTIDSLNKYLGEARELPISEQRFEFEHRPYKDFKSFKNYRNIMFLISAETPNEYNPLADAILSESAKKAVEENRSNFFFTKDLYAKKQSVLILIGKKDKDLRNTIGVQSKNLVSFDSFKESVSKRYANEVLFGKNEVKASAEAMMKQHSYSIDHSKFYKALDNISNPDSNIVSYFASSPLRYYWVKYFQNVTDHSISSYLDLRDKAHKMHFEGDIIDRENVIYTDSIQVGDLKALKIQATYITYDDGIPIGGGPCITYVIKQNNRVFLLDASVFKPGNRKSIELIELETIMKTFKIKKGKKND